MKTIHLWSKRCLVHVAFIALAFALGIQVASAQPPVLLSATASEDGSTVTAVFNEPVDAVVAQDTFNYLITSSDGSFPDIALATLAADQQTLTLSLVPSLTAGVAYTLVALVACNASGECTFDQSVPISFQGTPPNRPPVANGQSVSVEGGTAASITLSGSDPDANPLTFMIASSPTHGALSGTPPSVLYTPQSGYVGPDSFTFKVNDGITDSAPATVSIQVTPPQPPVLLSATASPDGTTVKAVFNEPLDESSATDAFNYLITGSDGSSISLVFAPTLAADHRTVTLSFPSGTFRSGVSYTLVALNICDVSGNCAGQLSAPIDFERVLIAAGSVWRYLDTGIDPGTAWIAPFFDDTSWAAGPAELGYGEGDEATVINSTVGGSNILITAYFRHAFNVTNASAISGLTLQLRRDDGAIVYLNGVEVFRNNMPPGPASYSTLASGAGEGIELLEAQLSSSALVSGSNVIAVEVHQVTLTSTDISFDLALLATVGIPPNNPPVANSQSIPVQPNTPASITLTGSDPDGNSLTFLITSFPTHGALSGMPPNVTYTPQSGYVGADSFTFKVNDGLVDSAPATVSIEVRIPSLVAAGSVWKYLDAGAFPGTTWFEPSFNDISWRVGPAELGFGDGDEATVIRSTPPSGPLITAYFRHQFTVADPSAIGSLLLQVWRDDGAIVYLNGVEVLRDNMPTGFITYSNLALSAAPDDGNVPVTAQLSSRLIVSGINLIAAEVHQVSRATNADLSFDLQLDPILSPNPPDLLSAVACGSVVTVTFDEALDPASAQDTFNYFILGSDGTSISVLSATLESDQRTVTLFVAPQFHQGISYTLQAISICDTFGDCLSQASVPLQFDTTPPIVTCNVAVNSLFPPNDLFINVGLTAATSEGALQVRVFSDEPELFGTTDATFDGDVLGLRARRLEKGDGRVYLIVVTATDACGNIGGCCKTVVVPHDLSKGAVNSVNAQAAAAAAQCSPQGAPSTPYQILP